MSTLILPGLGGSGPGHWQNWWLSQDPDAILVEQADWNAPDIESWIERASSAIEEYPYSLLVAHSLSCALVAHLAVRRPDLPIAAALLVAPADVDDRLRTPLAVESFSPLPLERLPYASVLVGSSNDPTVSIGRAMAFSHAWGARFIHLRDSGHINAESGFGPWPDGLRLAGRLREQVEPRRPYLRLVQAGAPGFV